MARKPDVYSESRDKQFPRSQQPRKTRWQRRNDGYQEYGDREHLSLQAYDRDRWRRSQDASESHDKPLLRSQPHETRWQRQNDSNQELYSENKYLSSQVRGRDRWHRSQDASESHDKLHPPHETRWQRQNDSNQELHSENKHLSSQVRGHDRWHRSQDTSESHHKPHLRSPPHETRWQRQNDGTQEVHSENKHLSSQIHGRDRWHRSQDASESHHKLHLRSPPHKTRWQRQSDGNQGVHSENKHLSSQVCGRDRWHRSQDASESHDKLHPPHETRWQRQNDSNQELHSENKRLSLQVCGHDRWHKSQDTSESHDKLHLRSQPREPRWNDSNQEQHSEKKHSSSQFQDKSWRGSKDSEDLMSKSFNKWSQLGGSGKAHYSRGKNTSWRRSLNEEFFDQEAQSFSFHPRFHDYRGLDNQKDSKQTRASGQGESSSQFEDRSWHRPLDTEHKPSRDLSRSKPKDKQEGHYPSQVRYKKQLHDDGKPPQREQGAGSHQEKPDRDKKWFENVRNFSHPDITRLSQLSPEHLVHELFDKVKALQSTLQRKVVLEKSGIMDAIVAIMSKIANTLNCNEALRYKACQILGEVLSDRCASFQFQLMIYVKQCSSSDKNSERKIRLLCEFFYNLLVALPSSSWSILPVDELNDVIKNNVRLKLSLGDQVGYLVELRENARADIIKRRQENSCTEEWDNSEFRDISILPQWGEVCVAQGAPRLHKNIVMGGYSDWLHYYDIQFRLLREDFMVPLRNGICDYLRGSRGRKLKNLRVYTNVLIREPVLSDFGVSFKIKIDVSRMRCNWSHSKRLIHGSLVCLSPDNFQAEVYFATISEREPEKIAMGELQIIFQNTHNILSFCCQNVFFTMVESHAYFEASRHILHSLQTAEIDSMPFTKYLIEGKCDSVEQPQYLNNNNKPYKLGFLLTQDEKSRLLSGPCDTLLEKPSLLMSDDYTDSSSDDELITDEVLIGSDLIEDTDSSTSEDKLTTESANELIGSDLIEIKDISIFSHWPSLDQIELDASQLNALQMALTQEIAIIQGPPGTGKTYIGLKIMEALLINKEIWKSEGNKSPILVMCFTNHALDQFLEGILDSPYYKNTNSKDIGLVRIGGRSQCERLFQFNLKYRRKNVYIPGEFLHAKWGAERLVQKFSTSVPRYFQSFHKFLHLEIIKKYISALHYSQLLTANTQKERDFALEIWLGLYQIFVPNQGAPSSKSTMDQPSDHDNINPVGDDSVKLSPNKAQGNVGGDNSAKRAERAELTLYRVLFHRYMYLHSKIPQAYVAPPPGLYLTTHAYTIDARASTLLHMRNSRRQLSND